jgi:ribosomal protein S18 acetylase RimI-like enzyme
MAIRKRPPGTAPTPARIRPAAEDDLPALARLGAKLAREHHAMDPARFFLPAEPIEEGYAAWLGKEVANPRAVVLAAVAGRGRAARIVGYAYGRLEERDWNTLRDRCGVGIDLWVEPAARRAGLGARLVLALAEALEARGAPLVILEVAAANSGAARLFEGLGFRPTLVEMTREARAPKRVLASARRRR